MAPKEKEKTKNVRDALNIDQTTLADNWPKVVVGEFDMSCSDVDALTIKLLEWIKIEVPTQVACRVGSRFVAMRHPWRKRRTLSPASSTGSTAAW